MKLTGVDRRILNGVACTWRLTDRERRAASAYLRGPRRCMDYDALPPLIRAVVRDFERCPACGGQRPSGRECECADNGCQ